MTTRLLVVLLFWAFAASGTDSPKTIVELQQFRRTDCIRIKSKDGRQGNATLVNLNPAINAWYLLDVAWTGGSETSYHLENPKPGVEDLLLDKNYPSGLLILAGKNRYSCDLFGTDELVRAKASPRIYSPLCEGRIYLRNPATGHRTTLETATEFLRDHVWGGEKIISLGHVLLGDVHRETGTMETSAQTAAGGKAADRPSPALVDPQYRDRLLTSNNLGIDLEGAEKTGMIPGAWYPASANPGVYVSIIQPNLIDPSILRSYPKEVNNLRRSRSVRIGLFDRVRPRPV